MKYEPVIGLEVHVQLNTKSKMFCSCSTEFGAEPNKNTCPICLGMPGVLPVINREAINLAIKTALATNCKIAPFNRFARKNYFYPDLPKGYQISQYEMPLAKNGHIDIVTNGKIKRIGITRVHMEEDAGKLIHGENLGSHDSSYVDMNRAGVPLMEVVSEPDIHSPEEAKEYVTRLKSILRYIEVSDCNMEEGSLRCDANVSIRPVGNKDLGIKTEVKNMNSFRFLQKALEYEIKRQIDIVEEGGKIIQETRLFNPDKGITISMRGKEEAHDYRYFPDPDLVPTEIDSTWIDYIRATIPELPDAKRDRFVKEYGLPEYDAEVITISKSIANYFENCIKLYNQPKIISNWVMGEVLRTLKDEDFEIEKYPVTPQMLTEMLKLIDNGTISGKIAKTVFEEMYKTGKSPENIVKEEGLVQITDEAEIVRVIDEVIASNPKEVADYKGGKEKLLTFFVGQVMKKSKGKANPQMVNKLLKERLAS
ncbi:MAG: Asp-tRNA(Asn)/Glu-tRNA(Gln) amidotransferase subunit GatB [Nitrospinota bacterium]